MGGYMKTLLLLSAIPALAACASTESIAPRIELVDRPPIQTAARAEVGETIVEKGKLSTYDGLRLKNELTWGDGLILKKFTMAPGQLRAKEQDAEHTYFFSDDMKFYDAVKGTSPWEGGGLCVRNGDPTQVRAFIEAGRCSVTPKARPDVEAIRITDEDAPHFRQELIYNGRSGDSVKFLYRELSGSYARPPFSQDVLYDLKDGNVIGFKGARIEIVEATNVALAYRVLVSFPDVQ